MLQSLSSDQLQVSIHPSASIGTAVFLDHATGIIIGAYAVIGDEVTILQNVTIGRKHSEPDRAPKIGKGAYLSAGSTIIGDVSIGDFAKVGAGALIEHDVPAGCTAVGVPARLTNCPEPMMQASCRSLGERSDTRDPCRGKSRMSRATIDRLDYRIVGWAKERKRRAHHPSPNSLRKGGHAPLCPPYSAIARPTSPSRRRRCPAPVRDNICEVRRAPPYRRPRQGAPSDRRRTACRRRRSR